jgi:hypothetical protein
MKTKQTERKNRIERADKEKKPLYVSPKVITYTSEEILEQIGPAQACSPAPCPAGN